MDWGCELPLYQRKDCTPFSTQRVDIDTVPRDMTPFWNWYAQIETLAVK
jgi:peptide/nickel transport system substrate-binding protein